MPLPGKRIAVMQAQGPVTGELADASTPITLPAPRVNDAWAQPGGEANNAPGNLAFGGAANVVWSADAGTGSGSVGRLTASPIVYRRPRFHSRCRRQRSAPSPIPAARAAWRISLKPKRESSGSWYSLGGGSSGGGYGGGLAIDGGRLYAASGYGNVVALDPQTGKESGRSSSRRRALLADGGRRSRVRRHARWPLLLPRRRRRRRALVGARPAAAGKPHQQREPGRRRRHRRRALSVRRSRRVESCPTARRCGRRTWRARARPRSSPR